ncbi:MAG: tetratricopeptide repeat protein, partial [Chitinophagaceae bacterium]
MYPENRKCTLFSILLLFFYTTVPAQSKQPVDSLIYADAYADAKKFDHAYRIYSKNTGNLNSNRQVRYAEVLLNTSKGKPERLAEAYNWYKKSADAGYEKGIYGLMVCYMQGYGTTKDSVQGLILNQKLVDLDYKEGIYLMALRYEEGYTVTKDKNKAVELFTKTAGKGHSLSAYILGKKQFDGGSGTGTLYWYKKSASYGYLPAMLAMAELYDKGLVGIPKNTEEALLWYKKITTDDEYSYHSGVENRIRELGAAEPSTNINTVKPVFLKLLSGAANNYSSLLSEEKPPLDEIDRDIILDVVSVTKYYTCTADLGFKNARIRERKIKEPENKDMGKIYQDMKLTPGTYYSYHAEIVNSISNENAIRIFNQWVAVLKEVLP